MIFVGILLILVGVQQYTAALQCYTCDGIDDIDGCKRISDCGSGQSCFTGSYTYAKNSTFSMGCTDNENCGNIPVYQGMSSSSRKEKCYECCSSEKCNNELCKHQQPPPCEDTDDNCAYYNEMFNICEDIHQGAKLICRKFCKLCSLVDGNWANWSPWSSCDVTCGHGQNTRFRTCSNPAPAYQGLDCKENSTDTRPCIKPLCPVHGGWAEWSNWGTCPVTCGVGIQKRHRNCSNPLPLRYGDHCFGDDMDVKICMQEPCNTSNMKVTFTAQDVTDKSPGKEQTLIFSRVLANQGGAYNSSSGVFVAPRNGTYLFFATICIMFKKEFHFVITVNNNSFASAYGYAYHSSDCPSAQAVVELKINDNVYVQWGKTFTYSSQTVINQNIYLVNQFSGSLIN